MASSSEASRKWIVVTAFVLSAIVFASVLWFRSPPPQLDVDERVFKTVDALFTAIRSRDLSRMEDCDRRLKTYREEGRISDAAAGSLDDIIQQARGGQWEPAAKRLYDFMRGQRGQVRTAVERSKSAPTGEMALGEPRSCGGRAV